MKERLSRAEDQRKSIADQQELQQELRLIVTNLKAFAEQICSTLENITWETKRSLIRMLVKHVEIDVENVNVVLKIPPLANPEGGQSADELKSLQHCCGSKRPALRHAFI